MKTTESSYMTSSSSFTATQKKMESFQLVLLFVLLLFLSVLVRGDQTLDNCNTEVGLV